MSKVVKKSKYNFIVRYKKVGQNEISKHFTTKTAALSFAKTQLAKGYRCRVNDYY